MQLLLATAYAKEIKKNIVPIINTLPPPIFTLHRKSFTRTQSLLVWAHSFWRNEVIRVHVLKVWKALQWPRPWWLDVTSYANLLVTHDKRDVTRNEATLWWYHKCTATPQIINMKTVTSKKGTDMLLINLKCDTNVQCRTETEKKCEHSFQRATLQIRDAFALVSCRGHASKLVVSGQLGSKATSPDLSLASDYSILQLCNRIR